MAKRGRPRGAKNRNGQQMIRDAQKDMKIAKLKVRLEKEKAKKKRK